MRGASRRRAKESLNPPPPQPTPDLYSIRLGGGSRDSDASFASSRPSSVGIGRGSITADVYSDRSHQIAAIRSINTYLSSHSFPFALPPKQVPSVKDITEILKFLIAQLDYPMSSTTKLEDELFVILRCLNCPYKINKSTLRSPNSPHNWPSYLALIHWLVQIASYTDHLLNNYRNVVESNSTHVYALNSYLQYIDGDDDAVEELDREFVGKLERERDAVAENLKEMIEKVATLEELQNGPTEKEKLEKEKSVLEEDVKKFNAMVISFDEKIRMLEDVYEEKEKEIRDNVEQMKRICDENEELKKRVELQTFNARDMERMKKELATVERDIQDAETARNGWEEKCWDLDAKLVHKFNDLQALSIQCNQAIRRYKLTSFTYFTLFYSFDAIWFYSL